MICYDRKGRAGSQREANTKLTDKWYPFILIFVKVVLWHSVINWTGIIIVIVR